jgi:hypothetical protein
MELKRTQKIFSSHREGQRPLEAKRAASMSSTLPSKFMIDKLTEVNAA